MGNNSIINQLEEELNKMKAYACSRPTYKIDSTWLIEEQRKVSQFNQSFYYKPAEVAAGHNFTGIKEIYEGKYQSAENYFKEAISYFNHPFLYFNLAKCYELQNKEIDFHEILDSRNIARLLYEFRNKKDCYINLCYINIDQIDYSDDTDVNAKLDWLLRTFGDASLY